MEGSGIPGSPRGLLQDGKKFLISIWIDEPEERMKIMWELKLPVP